MRKLAVVVMMIATGVFMAVTTASAQGWGAIHGNYEMVATGTCLHSQDHFTFHGDKGNPTIAAPYYATPNGNHFISAYMGEGTWSFYNDGTGMMQVMQTCTLPDYPGNTNSTLGTTVTANVNQTLMPSFPVPYTDTVPFAYVVNDSTITVVIGPPVGLTLVGKISRDHKTMTLQNAMQEQLNAKIGYYQICTIARNLIRISE